MILYYINSIILDYIYYIISDYILLYIVFRLQRSPQELGRSLRAISRHEPPFYYYILFCCSLYFVLLFSIHFHNCLIRAPLICAMSHLPCINPSCVACKLCLHDAHAKLNAMSIEMARLRGEHAKWHRTVSSQVDSFKIEAEGLEMKRNDPQAPQPKLERAKGVVPADRDIVWQPPHFETAFMHVDFLGRNAVQNKLYAPQLDIDGCMDNQVHQLSIQVDWSPGCPALNHKINIYIYKHRLTD